MSVTLSRPHGELFRAINGLHLMESSATHVSVAVRSRSTRRVVFVALTTAATFGLTVASVSAHLERSPTRVKPGASATITFTVAHGCAGSPTTKITMLLPARITNVVARGPKQWTASVAGGPATFSGDPVPANKPTAISLSFTAPKTEGVLSFPAVQQCVKGRTSWIEPTPPTEPNPTNPAPTITVSATAVKQQQPKMPPTTNVVVDPLRFSTRQV